MADAQTVCHPYSFCHRERKMDVKVQRVKGNWKRNLPLHLLLLVPVLLTIIYKYIPMIGVIMAFENYMPVRGIFKSPWVGWRNFQFLFMMPGFTSAIFNTFIIAVGKIILGILVPVCFSLMLNDLKSRSMKKYIQTIIYMPHFISWILMAGIINRILAPNGLLNQFITALGGQSKVFLADKTIFRPILWITDIWKEFGYGTIVYLAAICSIDDSLYEAAMVDGAGAWQQLIHVTLPGLTPTIILMTVLSLGNVLNAGFDQVFNLYSPIVYETGDIIDTFVYRLAFNSAQFSVSTAAGLFKSCISCVMIVASYAISYRVSGYRVF